MMKGFVKSWALKGEVGIGSVKSWLLEVVS